MPFGERAFHTQPKGFVKFVPVDMSWYWEDGDSQFAVEIMERMNELNQAIDDLIHGVE